MIDVAIAIFVLVGLIDLFRAALVRPAPRLPPARLLGGRSRRKRLTNVQVTDCWCGKPHDLAAVEMWKRHRSEEQ